MITKRGRRMRSPQPETATEKLPGTPDPAVTADLITAAVVDHPDTGSHELDAQIARAVPGLQAPARLPAHPPAPKKASAKGRKVSAGTGKSLKTEPLPVAPPPESEGTGAKQAPKARRNLLAASLAGTLRSGHSARPSQASVLSTASLPSGKSDTRREPERAQASNESPSAPPAERPRQPRPESSAATGRDAPKSAAEAAASARPAAQEQPAAQSGAMPDFDALTQNMGKLIDYSGKVAAAYLKPRETGEIKASTGEDVVDTFRTIGRVAESWLTNPAKVMQAQAVLTSQLFGLWSDSFARFSGGSAPLPPRTPRKVDKRFAAPEWQGTPMFDFLHQAYLVTAEWAKGMVDDAEGVDAATREKAAFYLRQVSSALSPANFLATNPELIKETFRENGENLVRGMQMLAEDIAAGKGELKIRQSDATKFKLGVDMAATPGKVIFRNALMELIQYAPMTETVLRRPLLVVPPWINKFYVLDLNKEKSFIRWMVSQGLTVFVISWVNPDQRHAAKDWDAYMREGIFAALDCIESAIGERNVTTAGYCVGGTLLAATLAYMAATDDGRVSSSTLLTTQVDFKDAGDLKVFADEAQIRAIEQEMSSGGYLPGSKMANAFNMLRPDDLIWSYAVNTYLKGKSPAAFDLLAWNADSTRMTAANHAFYLRNCYLDNKLTAGEMVIGGQRLNLGAVTMPIYDLAAKEDHIAPARSVFNGARYFGGPVRYVLAGSGHIAGVVNPPSRAKYQYWTGGKPEGDFEAWVGSATETKGTWWLDWIEWIKAQAPETVPAREPGAGALKPLADAPGDYVKVQS